MGHRGDREGEPYMMPDHHHAGRIMEVVIANVLGSPEHTKRIHEFLLMRQRVFVDGMSWDLNVHDGLEFEQYDQFTHTYYVLAHAEGRLVGGARLLRCDTRFGTGIMQYTYMIRDAFLGHIDLPRGLCVEDPPTDEKTWELTRLVVDSSFPEAGRAILDASNDFLVGLGAERCLFLGSPAFMRMARMYGYRPSALGPVCGNKDGRFVAFECPCEPRVDVLREQSPVELRA